MRLPGIGSHHSANPKTDEWLTPPEIIRALGAFDLDPCAPLDRPWDTAATHRTVVEDGLGDPWFGRVWLNPPYSDVTPWMERMARHGCGVSLVFARCDTSWWHEWVWPYALGLLFLRGRLNFYRPDGSRSKRGHNSGGPSVLIAYSPADARALRTCSIEGAYVEPRGRLRLVETDVARFCNAVGRLHAAGADADDLGVLLDVLDVECDASERASAVVDRAVRSLPRRRGGWSGR